MSLNSSKSLIARLRRGKAARQQFVESNLNKVISHQIRATRERLGWSQERLAAEANMNQNAISRLESSDYGRPTITTLKRLAATFDVGLIVRFVPFSEMVDWVSGTPRTVPGLTTSALAVASFGIEEREGALTPAATRVQVASGAMESARTSNGLADDAAKAGPIERRQAANAAIQASSIQQNGISGGALQAA